MSDIIREALFALADRIEEANGKPISVDTAAAYALRAAIALQPTPAAPVAQEPVAWQLHLPDGRVILEKAFPSWADGGDGYTIAPLHTAPPAAEQPIRATQALATISRMARNEACREGAPAAGQLCTFDAIADMADAALADAPAAEQPDAWTPSGADYDRNIHHNPDAAAWADLFVATFPGLADKHDLMLGWFANAMMAMHDFLKAEQPDAVAVPRELLDRAARSCANGWIDYPAAQELRALLAGGAE